MRTQTLVTLIEAEQGPADVLISLEIFRRDQYRLQI